MKHTPAPWIIKYSRSSKVNSHVILSQSDHSNVANVTRQCDEDENEANARLIAAAPKLLEALKEIISQIDQGGNTGKVFSRDYCIEAARAAILKAEG